MELDTTRKLLVLPKDRSPDSIICTFAHPRTAAPSRYLFDPNGGIYEFIRIAAPKSTCRSWLIDAPARNGVKFQDMQEDGVSSKHATNDVGENEEGRIAAQRYIISKAAMLVATPIDPLFLLLPALSGEPEKEKHVFLSCDDYVEKLSDCSKQFKELNRHAGICARFESRLQVVCDTVDAGGEQMYRLNNSKLLQELILKATKVVEDGLPASMEEKFVRRALDVPVLGIKREETSMSESQPATCKEDSSVESQSSTATLSEAASVSTDITVPDTVEGQADDGIRQLLRLRTVLNYMMTSYIPARLAIELNALLASPECKLNFQLLNTRLAEITRVRTEALTATSMSDYSNKRNAYEDDEVAEARASKKRKKEEEEKKKKLETRGIKDLKKADISGMKKMSDFFGKAASKKK
ncbi:uncharacterized protein KY384_000693 [Bacidia gigantensis]|uniref:uncharacterized protein n=1 Tax=Bacidia gigantensis TaxID=2732470 RepID=UPI001D056D52|nr:uncharacterized protein KY384_000693 [Bacidia gigantensis]KAG8525931.1 hypothetical protein KY384_000693 [Bacidia gigantensis]